MWVRATVASDQERTDLSFHELAFGEPSDAELAVPIRLELSATGRRDVRAPLPSPDDGMRTELGCVI